jgi:hypothetical protein
MHTRSLLCFAFLSALALASCSKEQPAYTVEEVPLARIPPDAQRGMSKRSGASVVEVKGSHAVYVSQPAAVAALIERAAKGRK